MAGNANVGDVILQGASAKGSGDTSGNAYTIGASVPVAGALSAGFQYFKAATAGDGNQNSAFLRYTPSKANDGYLNYSQFTKASSGIYTANHNGNFNTGDAATKRLIALGVAHSF